MKIRTIVVAADLELRNLYQKKVLELGVECVAVNSLYDLFETLKLTSYHGLLIDLATLVKADRNEKAMCHEMLRLFPTLRVRWDEESQQIRCLLYGHTSQVGMTLQIFIEEYCRKFEGRRIRRYKRMHLHYNTLLSKDEEFTEQAVERSTTLDISEGGCALLTNQEWALDDTVWLRFIEFEDQTPIRAKIRRWTRWGTPMTIPSIGVCFEALSAAQVEQIRHPGKAVYQMKKKTN